MWYRDNADLESDLLSKLEADGRIDARDIRIENRGNEVVLQGSVPSLHEKLIAEDHALQIMGRTSITNLLQVAYSGSERPPVEAGLQDRVLGNLKQNETLKAEKINVRAGGSKVVLEGCVDSTVNRKQAENEARGVPGVTEVVNHLAIVPSGDRKDELIGVEIMTILAGKEFAGVENIGVVVEGGKVTLQGVVPNWSMKSAVNKAARYPLGVFEVVDQLSTAREQKEE